MESSLVLAITVSRHWSKVSASGTPSDAMTGLVSLESRRRSATSCILILHESQMDDRRFLCWTLPLGVMLDASLADFPEPPLAIIRKRVVEGGVKLLFSYL